MSHKAIEATGLEKSYGAVRVLGGVDLAVAPGSVYALLGPNGAGKTTTVRILATLLCPDAGTARVAGHDVVTERAQVRRAISLTGQDVAVDELQTGAENLRMMARLYRLPAARGRARADELLDRFDLADAGGRRVATYSGGMRRRLDLAVSLIVRPAVLFLDEPTTGLDPQSRRQLWGVLERFRGGGGTILLTTHYMDEAQVLCDRVAIVDHGRVIALGSPQELIAKLTAPRVVTHHGTLEDVFMSLTGRHLRDDD
jgi:ABC-2 type transport system ATP-binding protein